jgi:hypothetical protein
MAETKPGLNGASVVIIGAGISGGLFSTSELRPTDVFYLAIGMCLAIDLIRRTHTQDFVILEKSSQVGGTWNDNQYPGYSCDSQLPFSIGICFSDHRTHDHSPLFLHLKKLADSRFS